MSQRASKSRKRRGQTTAPRAVASTRRQVRAERQVTAERQAQRASRMNGREGERPEGPFGGLPISELAILAGLVAAIIGFVNGGGTALVVGLVVCALGVVEVTAREHFAGYRSHAVLLAAIPAIAVEVAIVVAFGEPHQRELLLLAVVPVFGGLFWVLRRRFAVARQARVARAARPPAPPVS